MTLGENGGYGLISALDRLRDDFREDLHQSEDRLTAAIGDNRRALEQFQTAHANEHVALRVEREEQLTRAQETHDRFDAYMRSAKISQARRDGALGVSRFIIEVLGSNAPGIIKLIIAIAGAGAVLSGTIHLNIGVQ